MLNTNCSSFGVFSKLCFCFLPSSSYAPIASPFLALQYCLRTCETAALSSQSSFLNQIFVSLKRRLRCFRKGCLDINSPATMILRPRTVAPYALFSPMMIVSGRKRILLRRSWYSASSQLIVQPVNQYAIIPIIRISITSFDACSIGVVNLSNLQDVNGKLPHPGGRPCDVILAR